MRPIQLCLAWLGATVVCAEKRTTSIFLQPATPANAPPSFLAEVAYDPFDPSVSEVVNYEAPELPEEAEIVRVGVYDAASSRWLSSASVSSVDNFSKGYAPHFTVSVDPKGNYLGVSCKGVRIDAGQTRDFGPQSKVIVTAKGKQPELNSPVVLSPEGRKVEPEEKTFLQKYWWVLGVGLIIFSLGGAGEEK